MSTPVNNDAEDRYFQLKSRGQDRTDGEPAMGGLTEPEKPGSPLVTHPNADTLPDLFATLDLDEPESGHLAAPRPINPSASPQVVTRDSVAMPADRLPRLPAAPPFEVPKPVTEPGAPAPADGHSAMEHPDPVTRPRITRDELIAEIANRGKNGARDLDLSGYSLCDEDLSGLDLTGIVLQGADLRGCALSGAILRSARLSGADFSPLYDEAGGEIITQLEGANCEGADLQDANLYKARLWGTSLQHAQLQGANLSDADLQRAILVEADLSGTKLRRTKLEWADLTRAYLHRAHLQGADFTSTTLASTKVNRESLGNKLLQEEKGRHQDFLVAKDIYLTFKKNFQDIGDYKAASWACVKEREMERATFWPPNAYHYHFESDLSSLREGERVGRTWMWKFYARYSWNWLQSWLMWALFGYGEKPLHALYFGFLNILIFTVIFWLFGGLQKSGDPSFELGIKDYFLHALGSFTTIPYLEPVTLFSRVLTSLDAVAGVTSLAAFTSSLGQRIGSR